MEQVLENDSASSLIEQLGKTLLELEATKNASDNKVQWKQIEEHFRDLEIMLKKKSEELEAKEKEYEEKESRTLALLAEREAAVSATEQDFIDRRANYQPATLDPVDGGDNQDIPRLKTYLKDLRRNSQGKGGNSGGATGARNDANPQELAALKAVISCVEEYKLEADYPLDPLQKRVAQLERSKSDKKMGGDFGKHQQSKKHRVNGGYHGFCAPGGNAAASRRQVPPVFANRAAYGGMPARYPQAVAAPNPCDYQVPAQYAYAQQVNDPRFYYYPQGDSSYNTAPANYDGYTSSGLQPSHQLHV